MSPPPSDAIAREVRRVLDAGAITPHFQPIVDLHGGEILGFEGLMRGPSDSFLQAPVALIEAAAACAQLAALEMLAIRRMLGEFVHLQLPGRLFLNVTPATIAGRADFPERMAADIRHARLPAANVVIELTETHAVGDQGRLLAALRALRNLGLVVAIDDLGEGFSGLKRWSEVRPQFVKIDRHFVDGLSQDPLRQQFIRSIMDMARSAGSQVVAEGVETESDLLLLRQLGVHFAQGYMIARPSAAPRTSTRPELVRALHRMDQARLDETSDARRTTAAHLARPTLAFTTAQTCVDAIQAFRDDPHLYSIPVLDAHGRPLGLLRSHATLIAASRLYFLEVFGKQSCSVLMDTRPLTFDAACTLQPMAEAVSLVDERHLTDGFLVTQGGRYVGTGRIGDLLRAVSDSQLTAARYANPLTLLPGNVPLDEQVEHLLDARRPFCVVHWDIGSFKAFNDVYGYRLGDDMITMTARLLKDIHDPDRDMLGHVGGDDFVSVFTSDDWLPRVESALAAFDREVRRMYSDDHLASGGYVSLDRRGQEVFHPIATLAAGAVAVQAASGASHRRIARAAAESKRVAKLNGHSACFVDRRQLAEPPALPGEDLDTPGSAPAPANGAFRFTVT